MARQFRSIDDFKKFVKTNTERANKLGETVCVSACAITPEIALTIINTDGYCNRGKDTKHGIPSHVKNLAKRMREGKWCSRDGADIQFDENGICIDGGNRLNAVIAANQTVQFDLKFGCIQHPDKDNNRTRKYYDNTQIMTGSHIESRHEASMNILWRMNQSINGSGVPNETLKTKYNQEVSHMYCLLSMDHWRWHQTVRDGWAKSHIPGLKTNKFWSSAFILTYMLKDKLDMDRAEAALSIILQGGMSLQTQIANNEPIKNKCQTLYNEYHNDGPISRKAARHGDTVEVILTVLAHVIAASANDTRYRSDKPLSPEKVREFVKPELNAFFAQTKDNLTAEQKKLIPLLA